MQDNTSTIHVSLDLVKTFHFHGGKLSLIAGIAKDPEIRWKKEEVGQLRMHLNIRGISVRSAIGQ